MLLTLIYPAQSKLSLRVPVPLLFMLPLGFGIGLSIRLGTIIASNPHKARLIAAGCMGFIALLGLIVSVLLQFFRHDIIALFTDDDLATQLALSIWPLLCYYMFLIYIMGVSLAIYRALGMQWRAGAIISTSLFGVTMPLVLYFAVYRQGGLLVQWRVLAICYTFLQVALALGYLCLDWDKHAVTVRLSIARMATGPMNEVINAIASESTPLVV